MVRRSLTGYETGVRWRVPATTWHAMWTGTVTTIALPVGVQTFWPFTLPDSLTTKSARLDVTAAAATAGSILRAGVYLPDTVTGFPDPATRILLGAADSTVIGVKDIVATATATLPRSVLLYFSLLPLTSGCTVRSLGASQVVFPIPAAVSSAATTISGLNLPAQTDLTTTTAPSAGSALGVPRAFLRNDTV